MNSELSISILIPTYNHECVDLVRDLQRLADACEGMRYEILVSDDGSTDKAIIAANKSIDAQPGCRYLRRDINVGRAATRNLLAQTAQYDRLLFIDCHMSIIAEDFLMRYLQCVDADVAYGGYHVPEGMKEWKGNLRYRYEQARHHVISIKERQAHPYQDFHTSNFMIRRDIMLEHPFDERFRRYGYEDVFFGRKLKEAGIPVTHIDNPVGFDDFESNERFLEKTAEGLLTLSERRNDLRGYSRLLEKAEKIERWHLAGCVRLWHKLFGRLERKNLVGRHPNLALFNLWRMGTFFAQKKIKLIHIPKLKKRR